MSEQQIEAMIVKRLWERTDTGSGYAIAYALLQVADAMREVAQMIDGIDDTLREFVPNDGHTP